MCIVNQKICGLQQIFFICQVLQTIRNDIKLSQEIMTFISSLKNNIVLIICIECQYTQ